MPGRRALRFSVLLESLNFRPATLILKSLATCYFKNSSFAPQKSTFHFLYSLSVSLWSFFCWARVSLSLSSRVSLCLMCVWCVSSGCMCVCVIVMLFCGPSVFSAWGGCIHMCVCMCVCVFLCVRVCVMYSLLCGLFCLGLCKKLRLDRYSVC